MNSKVGVKDIKMVQVDIGELKPSEYNPRKASEKECQDLRASIEKFGLVDPIIVNSAKKRKNIVVGGHFRLRIAKDLGYKQLPVVYVDLPNVKQEKELNLRLNKNSGSFDYNLLADFDKSLLGDVGFSSEELDIVFPVEVKEDDFDAQAEYEKIQQPTTKPGDLYVLGEHRLVCGDATKKEAYELLLDGQKARMIFTDPPYNVNYKSPGGLTYNSHKFGGTGGKIFNDNKTEGACLEFYIDILTRLHEFSTDDCSIYWWFANKNNWLNRIAFNTVGWHISQIIIWLKNSMVYSRGQDYHRQYEPVMLGWKKGNAHYSNKKIRNFKDVFNLDFNDYLEMLDVWYQKRDPTQKYLHPTQKPVRLAERALRKNSQRGDIVLDAFAGSGSTLIGCEQMLRRCYLMDLDPKYCDVVVKRYETFTGRKAEKKEICKV